MLLKLIKAKKHTIFNSKNNQTRKKLLKLKNIKIEKIQRRKNIIKSKNPYATWRRRIYNSIKLQPKQQNNAQNLGF